MRSFLPIAALCAALLSSCATLEPNPLLATKAELAHTNARLDSLVRFAVAQNSSVVASDSVLAWLPAKSVENGVLIDSLSREVAFLRGYIESMNRVPAISPKGKLAAALPPAPIDYQNAQKAFNEKRYGDAAALFAASIAANPNSPWNGNASYWQGESLLALGNYADALAAFQKVFSYGTTDKYADAQYQSGVCFLGMGARERAAAEFRKLRELYPASPRVFQAAQQLQKIHE